MRNIKKHNFNEAMHDLLFQCYRMYAEPCDPSKRDSEKILKRGQRPEAEEGVKRSIKNLGAICGLKFTVQQLNEFVD